MKSSYSIPAASYSEECIIKKSQFITYLGHAADRPQAEVFIREIRQQHPRASHVCWAYVAGAPDTTVVSMSDAGEPSGTAGRPMLNVLTNSGLGEIVAAVVRYFGGIKLGTGGLQRAYSGAVSEALKNLPLTEKIALQDFMLELPYALEADVRYVFEQMNVILKDCDYQQNVIINASIAETDFAALSEELTNRSSGAIRIDKKDD